MARPPHSRQSFRSLPCVQALRCPSRILSADEATVPKCIMRGDRRLQCLASSSSALAASTALGASALTVATRPPSSSTITTTTTTSSNHLSTGAIIGIMVAVVVGITLCVWLQRFLTLYFYYNNDDSNTRPNSILSGEENGCCDMCCVSLNVAILGACCPAVLEKGKNKSLYLRGDQHIVGTGASVYTESAQPPHHGGVHVLRLPQTARMRAALCTVPEENAAGDDDDDEAAALLLLRSSHY